MNWQSVRENQPEETLSGETRARILAQALSPARAERRLTPLFVPFGRLVAAGSIPLALAGLLGVTLLTHESERPFTVAAAKDGDHVVFTIANGGRSHRVTKSDAPDRFESRDAVRVRGRFADTMEDDGSLVFYRIE